MSAAHTSGPWAVANWRETDKADRLIATVAIVGDCVVGPKFDSPYMTNYENHGSDVADANLIAAAPELLDIARRVEAMLTHQCWLPDGDAPESLLLRDARAAMSNDGGGRSDSTPEVAGGAA